MNSSLVQLDDRGTTWLAEKLKAANPLGQRFWQQVTSKSGKSYGLLPAGERLEPYNFERPLFAYERHGQARRTIQQVVSTESDCVLWVESLLGAHADWSLISESYLMRKADLALNLELPGHTRYAGEFVYNYVTGSDSLESLEGIVQEIYRVPMGLGALVGLRIFPGVGEFNLDEIPPRVQAILVGAYDGESIVAWVPHDSSIDI